MSLPKTCQAVGCDRFGRLYPSGRWCQEEHAPWRFADGRALDNPQEPGQTRYCAANRCYCGYCPSWRPPPPPPPPFITMAENEAMEAARALLVAQLDAERHRVRPPR